MSSTKSLLHQSARAFAQAGIPVFPCVAQGKTPACANGFHDATLDLATIDAWWTANPDYNIAFEPGSAGWLVVDIDPGADISQLAFPPTYEVRTPRGGKHLYFAGSGPTSANKISKHIDTRGQGGYVLAPPSRVTDLAKSINGTYEVINEDANIAQLPGWITARLGVADSKVGAAHSALDLPVNRDRARSLLLDYVRAGDVAIEGQGGDDRTYRLACEVSNLGLTAETGFALISEIWNPHCRPPWSDDELRVKVQNASQYAQNEAGAWAVAPAAETFAPDTLDRVLAEAKPQEPRSKFHFENETEMEQGKDPTWIVPELIPDETTVLLYGPTGSFKSFLAQDILMSVSTGVTTFGTVPLLRGPTFYGALEGRNAIKKGRRRAWKLAREIESLPDFYVGRAPIIAIPEQMQQFGDAVLERCGGRKPRLIVLDTIAKCMTGFNENDAGDAGKFIRFCDSLVEAMGCSVIAIGHTGKEDGRGHRGSSAFQSGFDTTIEVKAHRATKAVEVYVRQHKDAQEREQPWTFVGRELAGSLVFFPTDAAEHRDYTGKGDTFDPKVVGGCLQQLNAYGTEQSVSSHVLATALVPPRGQTEDETEYQTRVQRAARSLSALCKTRLEAYATRVGRELLWSLPVLQ